MNQEYIKLGQDISSGSASIDDIARFITQFLPEVIQEVNDIFSPRQLLKKERSLEPLPMNKRQLSSYRTRLGTTLEYALSTYMDNIIKDYFGSSLRLTFAVAHEYPDFYMRNKDLDSVIRIEMKAVDADSEEQAARFDVLSSLIQGEKDILILIGWEWSQGSLKNGIQYEYPFIFAFVVVPAKELAYERDESVKIRGGRVDTNGIYVPKKNGNPGELTLDQGNAGKILRIVNKSRKKEPFNLSLYIQQYLQFTDHIEGRKKTK